MRALPLTLGTLVVASCLFACGRVKVPANWGGGLDMSVQLDGMTPDLTGGGGDIAVGPDLQGPCAQCSLNATCNEAQMPNPCTCKPGFVGDGRTCNDVDECALNADDCDTEANCNNTLGGFVCSCKPGYRATGTMMGKAGECKQNWLPQPIIDESPDGGVPADMGSVPAATAVNTQSSASGVAVGSGSKIYLGPTPSGGCPSNGVYWRSFDPSTGKLTTEITAPVPSEVCSALQGVLFQTSRPRVANNGQIFLISPYGYIYYDPVGKSFSVDNGNCCGGTWDGTMLREGGNMNTRAIAQVGNNVYFIGGADNANNYLDAVHSVTLGAGLVDATQKAAHLPFPIANMVAVSAGTDIYLLFGDKNGTPATNDKLIRYSTTNDSFTPGNLTDWTAAPALTVPNNVDTWVLKNKGGLNYKDKLWFVARDFSGSGDVLRLWAFDPTTAAFTLGVLLPPSVGTNETNVRLAATTGSSGKLYLLGKGTSALEIYQYNE